VDENQAYKGFLDLYLSRTPEEIKTIKKNCFPYQEQAFIFETLSKERTVFE